MPDNSGNRKEVKRYGDLLPAMGCILISEPFMHDFYFRRSVVLLADHSHEGTFGLIINKPVDLMFNDIIKGFPQYNGKLYLGGPVKTSNLYFIHTLGDQIEGSTKIIDGLYWGGDVEAVKEMLTINQLNNQNIRFFIGYAGWVSKQLDRELDENSWVVADSDAATLLNTDPDVLWRHSVKSLGKQFAMWANYPIDPLMN
ncbi:MAG: YqgE/AlgH family protein [Bacteroidales bacterium]|nr:YqgE/AlgH family protein [Bacteroidales bacterium]MDZ4203744.1 YqgE/AlgH family protein [Bacteroidales bacterium]